jgi:hypothetical protein
MPEFLFDPVRVAGLTFCTMCFLDKEVTPVARNAIPP